MILGLFLIISIAIVGILIICVPYTPDRSLKRLEVRGAMIYPGSFVKYDKVYYRVIKSFSDYLLVEEL